MRRPTALLLALLTLAAPLLAGCLADEPVAAATESAPAAQDAGAVAGPAPSAPKEAFTVADEDAGGLATAYPVAMTTNPAKEPVTLDFTGEFQAQQCTPMGSLPFGGLGLASPFASHDLSDAFSPGDVYAYHLELRFTNTDQSWAEIHLGYNLGGENDFWNEPTGDLRGEVVLSFEGQGYRLDADDPAFAFVACWYGSVTDPIPYTLTARFTFAEAAVPAQTPVLLSVPDNATRLFVRGVPLSEDKGVLSHYRVFAPDDSLVCECALGSDQETATLELPGPGDYVVLVDHTADGFVGFALDAPPAQALRPLEREWAVYSVHATDGTSPVDVLTPLDFPSTPLNVGAWVWPADLTEGAPGAGFGKGYSLTLSNARGDVLRQRMFGFVDYRVVAPGIWTQSWYPVPVPGEWEFFEDHHSFDVGAHEAHLVAEQFRGEAVVFAQHYVRP